MYYSSWKPATDVLRKGSRWLVRMELAGVSAREVNIEAHRQELHVYGRRRDLLLHGDFVCQSLEIRYSTFDRRLNFPAPIDIDSIDTAFEDGILRISLRTL